MIDNYILDCTLRDGGYCNAWNFGESNIQYIIDKLTQSGVEYVECGFLSKNGNDDNGNTKFRMRDDITPFLKNKKDGTMYLAMINYGEYVMEELPEYSEDSIDGIRLAFHKKDMDGAVAMAKEIKEKGYKVFLQPMVSLCYSDEEFLSLIKRANQIKPYAFYIVDSFGVMKKNDLIRLFYLVENNLDYDIAIGYHAHNNMQLAYSNSQVLLDTHSKHNIIIDSSAYGMGRGAGNLNTELLMEYLNENFDKNYQLESILQIIDNVLFHFFNRNAWGYSLPNYLSAKHNCHPNYATFLNSKHTLTVENINEIFEQIPVEKSKEYDQKFIEELYSDYLGKTLENKTLEENENLFRDKNVLIIAPGKSVKEEASKVKAFIQEKDVIVISVNFVYTDAKTDYTFVSNIRRFSNLQEVKYNKLILTSNIKTDVDAIRVDYKKHCNHMETVSDNAVLLLISYLISNNAKKIYIAGVDGYSLAEDSNYIDAYMENDRDKNYFINANAGLAAMMKEYKKNIDIEYVTGQRYVKMED